MAQDVDSRIATDVETPSPVQLLASCSSLESVEQFVHLAAPSDAPVLVGGETGAGKEVVARALHELSKRKDGPFVAVNCGALPETLLESELFGHEKGAFTGADKQRQGRFELADGGTLFLDEIGELPLSMQVKLLRVLEHNSFMRVGGHEEVSVDVRIVAATNRDLRQESSTGTFRSDLFYRLNVLNISVPALRERRADILPLWGYFVRKFSIEEQREIPETALRAIQCLLEHPWPGNVRELENVARHAVTLSRGERIELSNLPSYLRETDVQPTDIRIPGMTLEELERYAILRTYEAAGNVSKTAEILGISVRKVQYRLKAYAADKSVPELAGKEHYKILLAEDDDDVRQALELLLQQEGYDVMGVHNGAELLQHLSASLTLDNPALRPDIILTDIRMPGLNGLRALEGVRAIGWEVPVVVISAFCDEAMQREGSNLGVAAMLDKPVDVETLRSTLSRVLAPTKQPKDVN